MTHITDEHRRAFEALTSGVHDNFALLSCFVGGSPAAANGGHDRPFAVVLAHATITGKGSVVEVWCQRRHCTRSGHGQAERGTAPALATAYRDNRTVTNRRSGTADPCRRMYARTRGHCCQSAFDMLTVEIRRKYLLFYYS